MMMRKVLIACCLILLAVPALAERQLMDRVIAVVNNDVILHSQLMERLTEIQARYANNPGILPPEDDLKQQILDTLIMEQVQLQRARSAGISVTDAELNRAMTRIASNNNQTLEGFQQQLASQGVDYAMVRRQVRQDLQIQQAQERFVARRIQVTDSEVRQYLQTQVSSALEDIEYRLFHVLVPADESDARDLAQAISDRVNQEDMDLETAASGRSVQDLGWRDPDSLPSLLQEPVRGLLTGDASAPFESPNGWHVVYMAEQSGATTQQITEYRTRHILINESDGLSQEAAEDLARSLYERITEGGESFSDLAREYSKDSGSARRGGDLGWNSAGVFVPEFAETIRDTPVNSVAEPFRSAFGWHIVEVRGEREADETFDNLRQQVQQILFEQKYAEALPRWQQEIKNNAYISIRDL